MLLNFHQFSCLTNQNCLLPFPEGDLLCSFGLSSACLLLICEKWWSLLKLETYSLCVSMYDGLCLFLFMIVTYVHIYVVSCWCISEMRDGKSSSIKVTRPAITGSLKNEPRPLKNAFFTGHSVPHSLGKIPSGLRIVLFYTHDIYIHMDKWMFDSSPIQCCTELASASHRGPAWDFHSSCCLPLPWAQPPGGGTGWEPIETCNPTYWDDGRLLRPLKDVPTLRRSLNIRPNLARSCSSHFLYQLCLRQMLPSSNQVLSAACGAGTYITHLSWKPRKTTCSFKKMMCPKSTRWCAVFFPKM